MASSRETAIEDLEQKLNQNPDSLVFSRIADGYRKRGDLGEAVNVCKEGISRHPDYVTGHIVLGRCYAEQESLKEAVEEFTRVCLIDRRNPMALKMMADIFAQQGMEEKAGDLYNYLLRMDPENAALKTLAAQYEGSGQSSLFDILGIAGTPPAKATPPAPPVPQASRQVPEGTVVETPSSGNGEVSLDQLSEGAGTDESIETLETMQMDRSDLLSAAGAQTESPESEIGNDVPTEEMDTVTGDDISDRMSNLFNDDETPTEEHDRQVESVTSESESQSDVEEILNPDAIDTAETLELSGTLETKEEIPDSNDIGSRISELFGEEQDHENAEIQEEVQSSDFQTSTAVPDSDDQQDLAVSSDDVASRIDEMFGEQAPEKPQEEPEASAPDAVESLESEQPVSSEDVAERIDEMFGAKASEESREEAQEAEGEKVDSAPAEGPVSSEDVEERIDEMFSEKVSEDSPESSGQAVTTESEQELGEQPVSSEDVAERIDEMFSEKAPEEARGEQDEAVPEGGEADPEEGPVSSEDIAERIDTMLTAGDNGDPEPATDEPELAFEAEEEPVSNLDSSVQEDNAVTGDDVSSRIDEMVGESAEKQEEPTADAGEDQSQDVNQIGSFDEEEVSDLTGELDFENLSDAAENKGGDALSGADVSSEIQEMFANDTFDEATEAITRKDISEDSGEPYGDDAGNKEQSLELAEDEMEEELELLSQFDGETSDTDAISPKPGDISEEEAVVDAADSVDQNSAPSAEEHTDTPDLSDRIANAETVMIDRKVLGSEYNGAAPEEIDEDVLETHDEDTPQGDDVGARIEELESGKAGDEEQDEIVNAETMQMSREDAGIDEELTPVSEPDQTDLASLETMEMSSPVEPKEDETELNVSIEPETAQEETDEWSVDSLITEEEEDQDREPIPSGDDVAEQLGKVFDELQEDEKGETEEIQLDELSAPQPEADPMATESEPAHEGQPPATDENHRGVEGQDIEERISEMFENDPLAVDESPESLPDDEEESEAPSEGSEEIDDLLGDLNEPDMSVPSEIEDAETAETIAYFPEQLQSTSQDKSVEETDSYSIPDHVLTPTLADIYYQQGQGRLAVQIYERLLQRDGENEKLRARLEEIRARLAQEQDSVPQPPQTSEERTKKQLSSSSTSPGKKKSSRKKKTSSKRPLEGVKIKKKFKERIRKKKKN